MELNQGEKRNRLLKKYGKELFSLEGKPELWKTDHSASYSHPNMKNQPLAEVFGFPTANFSRQAERYRKLKLCP